MKIYVDLLFLLNCWIDFFLLVMVKLTLRRVCKISRLLFGALFGGITTFLVFLNINYLILSFFKILLTVIMVIISFGFKDCSFTAKNGFYLFIMGIIFGGAASFIKIKIYNKIFYLILLIAITPITCYMFWLQNKKIKKQYNLRYEVKIIFINYKQYILCGFLDSGNNLKDPITRKPIIVVSKSKLKGINKIRSPMYVPYNTVNGNGLLKCYKPDELYIDGKKKNNYLVGLCDKKMFVDGVDCLLNNRLLEDI